MVVVELDSISFMFWLDFIFSYQVPGAEGLIIRVVSSVDKKLEVNPNFREVFKEEMYPSHFPYKSKVENLKAYSAVSCIFSCY